MLYETHNLAGACKALLATITGVGRRSGGYLAGPWIGVALTCLACTPGSCDAALAQLQQATSAADASLGLCAARAKYTRIDEIQGHGARSPLAGRKVTTIGRVSGVQPAPGSGRGFYLRQALAAKADQADRARGLYVWLGQLPGATMPPAGANVAVRGEVREHGALTQIGALEVAVCGAGKAGSPLFVKPDDVVPQHLEALEAMPIQLGGRWRVQENAALGRYGNVKLVSESAPDTQIILDDLRNTRFRPDLAAWEGPAVAAWAPLRGAVIHAPVGMLVEAFGAYRLRPRFLDKIGRWRWTPPKRADPPAPGPGQLRVVTLNAYNLFATLGKRGARSEAGQAIQRDKVLALLDQLKPGVVALQEVEANRDDVLQPLLRALSLPSSRWQHAPLGGGDGAIRNAVLYDAAQVRVQRVIPCPAPPGRRSPTTLVLKWPGGTFGLSNVHFKSLRGCKSDDCYATVRRAEVRSAHRCADKATPWMMVGDFNAPSDSPALAVLANAGWRDVSAKPNAYTYVYQGRPLHFDHAFVNASLAPQVAGAGIWHVNADAPSLLGYRDLERILAQVKKDAKAQRRWQKRVATSRKLPERASDHDPVWVDLRPVP